MGNQQQDQAFKEMVKHAAFADGADTAFDLLVRDGWTVARDPDGDCPPGFWVYALVSWEHRVLMRECDGSFWALDLSQA